METKIEKPRFEQLIKTDVSIAQVHAVYDRAVALLARRSMRPLLEEEARSTFVDREDLRDIVKGKWFWIAGEGPAVGVSEGLSPLAFAVSSDATRFSIVTGTLPDYAAPIVIGKKISSEIEPLEVKSSSVVIPNDQFKAARFEVEFVSGLVDQAQTAQLRRIFRT